MAHISYMIHARSVLHTMICGNRAFFQKRFIKGDALLCVLAPNVVYWEVLGLYHYFLEWSNHDLVYST